MAIGVLTLYLHLPGCSSLKEKRSRLKPVLARLHREFNISVAEMDQQDTWQNAVVCCAIVSNSQAQTQRSLQKITHWLETSWPDVEVEDDRIEVF